MRTIVLLVGVAGLLYAALSLYIWKFQAGFVYFPDQPGRSIDQTPADIGLNYSDVRFSASDGVELHGWFIPGETEQVLLYFHGNAGNISHRLDSIRFFHQLGLSTFIIDYRGYGRSTGHTNEDGTYHDAMGAWQYLTEIRGIDSRQIVLFGRSLGGAIAAWLANEVPARALILSSTFSSITDMARVAFPYLPAGLARIRYDTQAIIPSITCPILLLHSRDDDVIPFAMGEKLAAAAPAGTVLIELQGGHNDTHLASGATYTDAIRQFLAQHGEPDFSKTPGMLQ